jgi:hypothetical protein
MPAPVSRRTLFSVTGLTARADAVDGSDSTSPCGDVRTAGTSKGRPGGHWDHRWQWEGRSYAGKERSAKTRISRAPTSWLPHGTSPPWNRSRPPDPPEGRRHLPAISSRLG